MDEVTVLLAVDPGLRHCGCALFVGERLAWAGLPSADTGERGPAQWVAQARAVAEAAPHAPDRIVIEAMEIYADTHHGAAKQLLELTGVAGAVAGQWPDAAAEHVRPRIWKGRRSKTSTNARSARALTDEEHAVLKRDCDDLDDSDQQHIYDAVGIGLWALRRLGR